MPVELYMGAGGVPTSYATTTTKERANNRFSYMVKQLQIGTNIYVTNVTAPGADINTAPTSISFTLEVEHGDSALITPDENNAGQFLTGIPALKRMIARAMTTVSNGDFAEIYDPSLTGPGGAVANAVRFGSRIVQLATGALTNSLTTATAAITITAA
jgi:uncharacterized membrane protein